MSEHRFNAIAPIALTAVAGTTSAVLVFFLGFDRSTNLNTLDKVGVRDEIHWGVSYIALLPALAWLGMTAYRILREYSPRSLRKIVVISCISTAVATIGARFVKGPGDALVRNLDTNGYAGIVTFTAVAFSLAVLVITLVMSACVALAGVDSIEVASLRRRGRNGRLLLYSSAATLVVGVFQMWALIGWATHQFYRSNSEPDEYLVLAGSVGLGCGALYSLLLLLFFVPVAVAFQDGVDNAFDAAKTIDRDTWLATNGLGLSLVSAAVDIMAIASPIVTAMGLLPVRHG